MAVKFTVDKKEFETENGTSILKAARNAGIYIPSLCTHPDLLPLKNCKSAEFVCRGPEKIESAAPPTISDGCRICIVNVEGTGLVTACDTAVTEGMVVSTDTSEVKQERKKNLLPILTKHPHACLTCAQQEGCVREPCSSSVPAIERCCQKFGKCELQQVVNYIGVMPETPKFTHAGLPVLKEEPLFTRDFNLCINCARCVRACNDLRGVGVLGFVFRDGQRVVGLKAPDPKSSDCRFCGACVEVCPTGALMDREPVPENAKEKILVPCRNACPAGANIPEYVRYVGLGQPEMAIEIIRERALLPLTLGHICLRPCESKCRRSLVDEPLSIRELKKSAARRDTGKWKSKLKMAPATDKSVAIVGAGPSGLSAAFLLHLKGHHVAVLEAEDKIGGVLEWGIPSFRLPKNALENDLKEITSDILIRTGVRVGTDVVLDDLVKKVDAVLIATGLPVSRKLTVEGSDLQGVLWGLDFLREYNAGKPPILGARTIVIGGGNVAVDVARAAIRAGAMLVTMVCVEKREEMPASPSELEEALDESVEIMPMWGPKKIAGEDGTVKQIELWQCTRVFDTNGRFAPMFDQSRTTLLEADTVIFAIGQDADLSFIQDSVGIKTSKSAIIVDKDNMTSRAGVFASGDIVKQPGSVIDAVAAGRMAASAIDRYLGGDGNVDFELWTRAVAAKNIGRIEGFGKKKRMMGKHRKNFDGDVVKDGDPVEQPLDDRHAQSEALRCLQCDLRLTIGKNPSPPENWHPMNPENVAKTPPSDGVYILLDEKKQTIKIAGVPDIRKGLEDALMTGKGKYFHFEEDKMYTKKESELLQQYLAKHGKMPGADDEEDELF